MEIDESWPLYIQGQTQKKKWPTIFKWQASAHRWHRSKIRFKLFPLASSIKKADIILPCPNSIFVI